MLSAAGCGYDNAYGRKYRTHYPAEDLRVLKDNEELLTVCGGQRIGALYHLLVILPARAEQPCDAFYTQLLRTDEQDIPREFFPLREQVYAVCRVMVKHYSDYISRIWPVERERIISAIQPLRQRFEESDFTARAEQAVGVRLPADVFSAAMVSSVQGGAEAIDISEKQDVFGIEHTLDELYYFIGHEFIINLLKEALRAEDAFYRRETWALTEGLAEYYLKKVLGDTRLFAGQQCHVLTYERLARQGCQTPAGLLRAAYAEMMEEQ